jgi:hypothetical protein
MLIFVPILSGAWDGIRDNISIHNKKIKMVSSEIYKSYGKYLEQKEFIEEKLKRAIQISKSEFKEHIKSTEDLKKTLSSINEKSQLLENEIDTLLKNIGVAQVKKYNFPNSWAKIFFASLFAAFAQLFYQLFSPKLIKDYTIEKFIEMRKGDSNSNETIKNAHFYLDLIGMKENGREVEKIIEELKNMKGQKQKLRINELDLYHLQLIHKMLSEKNVIGMMTEIEKYLLESIEKKINTYHADEIKRRSEIYLIERGAKAEYMWLSLRWPFFIIITYILYMLSIWLILRVIYQQSLAVMKSTGYESLISIFM